MKFNVYFLLLLSLIMSIGRAIAYDQGLFKFNSSKFIYSISGQALHTNPYGFGTFPQSISPLNPWSGDSQMNPPIQNIFYEPFLLTIANENVLNSTSLVPGVHRADLLKLFGWYNSSVNSCTYSTYQSGSCQYTAGVPSQLETPMLTFAGLATSTSINMTVNGGDTATLPVKKITRSPFMDSGSCSQSAELKYIAELGDWKYYESFIEAYTPNYACVKRLIRTPTNPSHPQYNLFGSFDFGGSQTENYSDDIRDPVVVNNYLYLTARGPGGHRKLFRISPSGVVIQPVAFNNNQIGDDITKLVAFDGSLFFLARPCISGCGKKVFQLYPDGAVIQLTNLTGNLATDDDFEYVATDENGFRPSLYFISPNRHGARKLTVWSPYDHEGYPLRQYHTLDKPANVSDSFSGAIRISYDSYNGSAIVYVGINNKIALLRYGGDVAGVYSFSDPHFTADFKYARVINNRIFFHSLGQTSRSLYRLVGDFAGLLSVSKVHSDIDLQGLNMANVGSDLYFSARLSGPLSPLKLLKLNTINNTITKVVDTSSVTSNDLVKILGVSNSKLWFVSRIDTTSGTNGLYYLDYNLNEVIKVANWGTQGSIIEFNGKTLVGDYNSTSLVEQHYAIDIQP